MPMSDQHDLELIILGHAPIIQIETHEETRALNLLVRIATSQNLPLYKWAVTEGLRRMDIDLAVQRHNSEPKDVLSHIKASDVEGRRSPSLIPLTLYNPKNLPRFFSMARKLTIYFAVLNPTCF